MNFRHTYIAAILILTTVLPGFWLRTPLLSW